MNRVLILFCVIVLSAFFGACAEGASHRGTGIATDQAKGVVTIFVGDKPVLQINKDGLLINGNIAYGGTLTAVSSHWIKARIDKGLSDNRARGGHANHAE